MTYDMWHMTFDRWQVGGGETFLKISAAQLLRFWSEGILKIIWKKGDSVNQIQVITYWVTKVFVNCVMNYTKSQLLTDPV